MTPTLLWWGIKRCYQWVCILYKFFKFTGQFHLCSLSYHWGYLIWSSKERPSSPSSPLPFFFKPRLKQVHSEWVVWSQVTREVIKPFLWLPRSFFFHLCNKGLWWMMYVWNGKVWQQRTTNCKSMNSDYTYIIKANCFKRFCLDYSNNKQMLYVSMSIF